jgi:hypothetical protein
MRIFFAAAAIAAAVAGYSTVTLAQDRDEARCVALINQTQNRIGNTPRGVERGAVQRELDAAYSALKQGGDRRACLAHARRAADMVGGSGSSRAPDRYYDRRYDDRYDRRYDDRRYDDRRDSGGLGELIERSLGTRGR